MKTRDGIDVDGHCQVLGVAIRGHAAVRDRALPVLRCVHPISPFSAGVIEESRGIVGGPTHVDRNGDTLETGGGDFGPVDAGEIAIGAKRIERPLCRS